MIRFAMWLDRYCRLVRLRQLAWVLADAGFYDLARWVEDTITPLYEFGNLSAVSIDTIISGTMNDMIEGAKHG